METIFQGHTKIALAFALTRKRIGLLFTHKNGDFGAISVTERSCAARTGESHIGQEVIELYWIAFRVDSKSFPV